MRRAAALCLLALLCCSTAWAQEEAAAADSAEELPSEPVEQPRARKAAAALSVDSITGVVFSAEGRQQSSVSGGVGDTLFKATKLATAQSVEVTFTPKVSGEASKPAQAMLLAESKAAPGLAAYAIAKVKRDGSHSIALSTAAIEKQIANVGGELSLSLLLGDPSVPLGLRAELGSIVLPDPASGAPPKPRLLAASNQPVSNIKPNIAHTFRPAAKRPPAVVSLAFAAAAFLPLAALVVALSLLGVNLKGLPSGASNLFVILFHGGIASLLALYLLFWLRLNLAQTLPLALGLGLFTAGSGYTALSALSAERLAAEGGKGAAGGPKKTN